MRKNTLYKVKKLHTGPDGVIVIALSNTISSLAGYDIGVLCPEGWLCSA